jgi:hypothetical protein
MQKVNFQEYLYHPENYKKASLAELKEIMRLYPWFSCAAIILLICSKMQSDPDFGFLLKKHSIHIPDRKFMQKLVHSSFDPKPHTHVLAGDIAEVQEMNSVIPGLSGSGKNNSEKKGFEDENSVLSTLKNESLLDFAYSSKKTVSEICGMEESEVINEMELKVMPLKVGDLMDLSVADEHSFDHWISKLGGDSSIEKSPYKKQEIIESFIHSEPGVIRADKETRLLGDISMNSAEENEGFITDTLARIYLKQGLYNKAIYAYEKLCLKYPEKSIYFVTQIEEIKSLYLKK